MTIQNIIDKFVTNPKYLDLGAGKLASRFNTVKEDIYKAKEQARQIINNSRTAELQTIIADQEEHIAQLLSSEEGVKDGVHSATKTFSSVRILTQAEIKELSGVDDITSRLGMVWSKLQASGKWTYSIQVVYTVSDFYTREDFKKRLSDIFSNDLIPYDLPEVKFFEKDTAAFVYIADDHVGLKYSNSLFDNEYSGEVYEDRIKKILVTLLNMANVEHIYIVRLGDEADGYNGRTTRQDHELGSESNKEQFDTFTRVNKSFYDTLFSSGKAKSYSVINCNNSNHTGLGFSYMLNKSVEFYLEGKYPQVQFRNIEKLIEFIEWGNHVVAVTHGKDEKYMKRPMPLNLTSDTDNYLYDLYDKKGYSPNRRWISLMKGDLHKYNVNEGKSGRYINVPSIAGGSLWIEHNFGNSKPGVLLEFLYKEHSEITSIPIRF